MRKVWVVVANSSKATIYRAENVNTLIEARNLAHPESRLNDRDLATTKPGIVAENKNYRTTHAMEDRLSPKTREKQYFAEELAQALEEGYQDGKYERLYLIGNLPFLSYVHEKLDPQIEKLIESEIHKDLTLLKAKEIRDYLPPVL